MTGNSWPDSEAGAFAALDGFMAALNARDGQALYDLLHVPHVRISGNGVAIWHDREELEATYLSEFYDRAGPDWDHTVLDSKEVVHSSENKVARPDTVHPLRQGRRRHRNPSFPVDNGQRQRALGSASQVQLRPLSGHCLNQWW